TRTIARPSGSAAVTLDSRTLAWATLAHKSLPQRAVVALLREFGGPESLPRASRAELARVVAAPVVERALAPVEGDALERTTRWLGADGHELIAWGDDDYPKALLEVGDSPPGWVHDLPPE